MAVEVTLKSGEIVTVNDHVYCSPSWAARDGTPYSIARIMEFLPAEGTPKGTTGEGATFWSRVRLAWYYRPGDVSDRVVVDNRLLLAAIYSEICETSQLRAKCFVLHRDKISDLASWKKRPDRFYFNRLFDPYIRKEFDVILTSEVKNLPENVCETLLSRYEYIVAEKEIVPDLTANIRLCDTCQKWCAPQDTVKCDRCQNFFHMGCVQPPLSAKPSRGYGWTCAPCSRRHEEEVDSHEVIRHSTPSSSKPKASSRARGPGRPRKDRKLAEQEENAPIKHFGMWPFRYFGIHTVPEDTVDPNDFIFPRIATRTGLKFQANVPTAPDPTPTQDEEQRGGDSTLEVFSFVSQMSPEEVNEFEKAKDALPVRADQKYNVDFLTEATKLLSAAWHKGEDMSAVKMKLNRQEKWKKNETRWIDRDWNSEEKAIFEDAIQQHGAELRLIREEIGTRSVYEVARYYGHWKSSKLKEVNAQIRRERSSNRKTKPPSPPAVDDDSEGSIVKQPRSNVLCASCKTRESTQWWKAPKGLSSTLLCDDCGISWRKYADFTKPVIREESVPASAKGKAPEKREGTPLNGPNAKRSKTTKSVTPPASTVPQEKCLACNNYGPLGKIIKCQECGFKTHPGVFGVTVESLTVDNWLCELCQNDKVQEASLDTSCLLCPKVKHGPKDGIYPSADTFLRAEKPTEGQGWVHVICSVFIPELTFSDTTRLRLVEGISVINPHRWLTPCSLCSGRGGAVVRCCDCSKEFHVSCAWTAGNRFGFEIQTVRQSKRDQTTIVNWNGDSGNMVPVISCREHSSRRVIHEMCETNDVGETALQVYCQQYKSPALAHTHALLRKARRLDQVLGSVADVLASSRTTPTTNHTQCSRCKSNYSPMFYPNGANQWTCHKCHYESRESGKHMNGTSVADVGRATAQA